MAVFHLVYDLVELYGIIRWSYPGWFSLAMNWGGVAFFLISGVSATLGRRSLKRGALVFSCGMLCTAVTLGMYLLGFSRDIIIYFGALHNLGACMMLWPLLKKLPSPASVCLGIVLAWLGLWLQQQAFPFPWLIPLGLTPPDFASSDYFPVLPYLGFFLLGTVLGRWLYPEKVSLFPGVDPAGQPARFLCFCGRASLPIYLLHQPVFSGLCLLICAFRSP